MQAGADGAGIVALIGEKIGGPLLGQGEAAVAAILTAPKLCGHI
jgi:hypothetical protein